MTRAIDPPFKRILFPSDFAATSNTAFEHVRLLASMFEGHVILYHALAIPAREVSRWVGHADAVPERALVRAKAELERQAAMLPGTSEVVVDPTIRMPGLLDMAVLQCVVDKAPDLVVMATHNQGAASAFFLGSVTEGVLRAGGRPVLAVPSQSPPPEKGYRRLVLATDFSHVSREALPFARRLAQAFGAEVFVVHVKPSRSPGEYSENLHDLSGELPTETMLRQFAEELGSVRVTPRLEHGGASDRILAVADDVGADLIIMSTRGADSLGDRILGSQTERVIRRARCAVLAVPAFVAT